MATTYKGYNDQATGSNAGTWGQVLNEDWLDYVDQNLGGITSKSLTNTNVTLTANESRDAILRFTGTLTGAVQITTQCIGFFFVENLCTGAFALTVRNNLVATAVTIPQGTRQIVISDGTNGCRLGKSMEFPAGTSRPYYQNAAPAGWSIETSLNDRALRVVSGSGAGGGTGGAGGGSTAFSSVFTNRTISIVNLPNFSVGINDPGHTHTYTSPPGIFGVDTGSTSKPRGPNFTDNTGTSFTGITAAFGAGQRGGAQQQISFATLFSSVIIATKLSY